MDLLILIMDGGERSSFNLIEQTFAEHPKLPNIMCVWCAAHGFSLLLKAFGNIDGIDELIEDVKFVINYVRNHGMLRSILRELHRLSLLVWCITRFGTIFICMERLIQLENALRKLVIHEKWEVFFGKQYGEAKEKAVRFRNKVEDRSFFVKLKKTTELTEPVYAPHSDLRRQYLQHYRRRLRFLAQGNGSCRKLGENKIFQGGWCGGFPAEGMFFGR